MSRIASSLLALAAVVMPLALSRVLVTTDGPSHTYNAFVQYQVLSGAEPYRSLHTVDRRFAPNRAAEWVLGWIGPRLGWEAGERVLLSAIVAAQLAAFLLLLGPPGAVPGPSAWLFAALSGWLTQNLFVWMGFFDFSLSVSVLALLVAVEREPRGRWHYAIVQVLLVGLFLCHLFTFALGLALVQLGAIRRTRRGEGAPAGALMALPGLLLLAFELATRGDVGGQVFWPAPVRDLAAAVVGDVVATFSLWNYAIGVPLMVLVLSAAWQCRATNAGERLGLLLLVASPFLPDAIGDGSYIRSRARLLALVLLLPVVGRYLAPLVFRRPTIGALLALALFGGLGAQAFWIVRLSDDVARDLAAVESALVQAGGSPGDFIGSRLTDRSRGLFRIFGYNHVIDRIALRRSLVSQDNYETRVAIFPVKWKQRLDGLRFDLNSAGVWRIRLLPRERPWDRPTFLVHEATDAIDADDSTVGVGATVPAGSLAVTRLTSTRSGPSPGEPTVPSPPR